MKVFINYGEIELDGEVIGYVIDTYEDLFGQYEVLREGEIFKFLNGNILGFDNLEEVEINYKDTDNIRVTAKRKMLLAKVGNKYYSYENGKVFGYEKNRD